MIQTLIPIFYPINRVDSRIGAVKPGFKQICIYLFIYLYLFIFTVTIVNCPILTAWGVKYFQLT